MPTSAVASLREDLLAVMDRKDHWAWPHFEEGKADLDQLLIHFRQEYEVYVRDFPILLSRVHSRCPAPEARQELAENLYEEETGKLSIGVPHPELFLQMMKGLRFPRSRFREVDLLPEAAAYRTWIDQVTTGSHWVEGAALVVSQFTLAADTSRGNRPGFSGAAAPEMAKALYLGFADHLRGLGIPTETGRFGAHMDVSLTNDGPVTLWLEA